MALDGVAGEVLYPSQGLFYFKVADTPLMSAIFRACNDWLADFCRTDPTRLKGIAMINLADVQDGDRGAGARRPPGPGRRDNHRVSTRASALRPALCASVPKRPLNDLLEMPPQAQISSRKRPELGIALIDL
jgi:hypothetical protein